MKFYSELLERAGLTSRTKEVALLLFSIPAIAALLVFAAVGVLGLSLCIAALVLAAGIEVLRLLGERRLSAMEANWPAVFDIVQSGVASGLSFSEQLEYLAESAPISHRQGFRAAFDALERGHADVEVLEELKKYFASRHGDLLALLMQLERELGGVGMEKTLSDATSNVRREIGELGQLLAKQGWVSLSAKLALLAPWLVALVLVQLPQNREAFATPLGALVLVLGLALSLFAYALVNQLGQLTLPKRVLNGAG